MKPAISKVTAIVIGILCLTAAASAQPPPETDSALPAEISLGAASPKAEKKSSLSLMNLNPGPARWSIKGPEGWVSTKAEGLEGTIGPEPLAVKISLKCLPAPEKDGLLVPAEIAFECQAGRAVFTRNLLPGRYREKFTLIFPGQEKQVDLFFRILKDDNPVLLVDSRGLDFGSVERGRTENKRVLIRNPGNNVLSWNIRTAGAVAGSGQYISLLNQTVSSGAPYGVPSHLNKTIELEGDWTAIDGYPLAKNGGSFRVNFTGRGIAVYGSKDSDPGVLKARLDGRDLGDVPCGSGYLEISEILQIGGLGEGPHSLVFWKENGVLFVEGLKVQSDSCLKPPPGWLKAFPGDGTTTSETDFVNFTLNTTNLPPGLYCEDVAIESNSGTAVLGVSANIAVPGVPEVLKIYRFTRGKDILYSCNPEAESPGKMAGYLNKALAFRLYRSDTPGTRELYRWYSQSRGSHYYTTSREGDRHTHGYVLEGPIGNIATSRLPATRELYHWFNPRTGLHFYTTDPKGENSAKTGYSYEGIVGYVR